MMTTSGAPAAAAPPPSTACPASAIPLPFAPQTRVVPRHETLGRIVTAQAHEVYAHRRLDERREVPPRAHGQDEVRDGDTQDVHRPLFEAEPVNLGRVHPALQPDVQPQLLRAADGRDAEQLADVEDAEAANLHVLAQQVGRAAHEQARPAAAYHDEVVGDQLVAAHDEVERALRFAHAGLALDEHAESVEV